MPARRPTLRVGQGWDIHRLVADRPLMLGGVHVPYDRGLLGHSDGDAVLHAVADALLGAMAAGDIGQHFPDTDPRHAGADSAVLLAEVVRLVAARGARVVNVDVSILAEQPKLAPFMAAMRASLAALLAVEESCVGLKARTMEGLGAIGAGEAIAAQAVALVELQQPLVTRRTRRSGRSA
jgi:2-C-methyl-D-erythritol 2,4-cyclodiphosphate synthase